MTLVGLVVILILIGVGLYFVNRIKWIDANFKTLINIVVFLVVVLWLISVFGLFDIGPVIPRYHR